MSKKDLLAAIDAEEDTLISFLQSFLRAPSPNPPGDTREAAQVLVDYLSQRRIETKIIAPQDNSPNVVSSFKAGTEANGPHLVLNGHIDVFPVIDGEQWDRAPWSGDLVEGCLHGRGGVDMKAGTAASVAAYAFLHAHRAALNGTVALTAVSDEETGGKYGSRWLLEQDEGRALWKGDCMINAEPGSLQSVRFGEKGTLRITFTINTIGAHGAYLHLSEGANRVAARFICMLLELEKMDVEMDPAMREYLSREDVKKTINNAMGPGAADYVFNPTVNVGVIKGGAKVNMIPDTCIFEVDIRMPLGTTKEVVLPRIDDIVKDAQKEFSTTPPHSNVSARWTEITYEVQQAASNQYSSCPPDHPMVKLLQENAKFVTEKEAPVAIPSLGATDTKFWRYHGVPAYIYGVSPDTMAARNENVSVEEFLTVVKVHTLAAWDYLGGPP